VRVDRTKGKKLYIDRSRRVRAKKKQRGLSLSFGSRDIFLQLLFVIHSSHYIFCLLISNSSVHRSMLTCSVTYTANLSINILNYLVPFQLLKLILISDPIRFSRITIFIFYFLFFLKNKVKENSLFNLYITHEKY